MFLFQGLLTVTDKYIYDELVKGKEDDSFYKGYANFLYCNDSKF